MQPEIPRRGEEKYFRLIWIRQSGELMLDFVDDIVAVKNSVMIWY